MKRSLYMAMGCSVALGIGVLFGCDRPDEPITQTPPVTPVAPEPAPEDEGDADTSPPAATQAQPSTPEQPRRSAEARAPTTRAEETPINPPQAARLTAQQADAQINLRSRPTVASASKGYGLVGDAVKLLRAAAGSDGLTWYYVEFNESGAEGWIRGDFIDTAGNTAEASSQLRQEASIQIGSYTVDELFAAGGGGCGMTLWRAGTKQYIFFHGLEEGTMWMKLNGELTRFRRTAASGETFYGQATNQRFASLDGGSRVDVTVTPGSDISYEAMSIDSGLIRVESGGEEVEIPVAGDAGC